MSESVSLHEIRLGLIRATIWQSHGGDGQRYTVTLSRGQVDGHRTTNRFELDDLPLVAEVMDLAHLWICERAELIA
jgi:hypothetical protein